MIHEPFHCTAQDMQEFQDTVSGLLEIERFGLVSRVFTQRRTTHGAGYYDLAMVQGGLTEEGKRLLEASESQSARDKLRANRF